MESGMGLTLFMGIMIPHGPAKQEPVDLFETTNLLDNDSPTTNAPTKRPYETTDLLGNSLETTSAPTKPRRPARRALGKKCPTSAWLPKPQEWR